MAHSTTVTKGILKEPKVGKRTQHENEISDASSVEGSAEMDGVEEGPSATEEMNIMGDWERARKEARPEISSTTSETIPDHAYDINGMDIKQLPWTREETEKVLSQIKMLQDLTGEYKWIKKEKIRELERRLQTALDESGSLRRDDILLEKIAEKFRHVNAVDMAKLSKLLERNDRAAEIIEGKDVLLLCGETGSGKTTTLHFLAGSTFEETEVDGFLHYRPISWRDPSCASFKTSYSREPTTRVLQAVNVPMRDGEEVAICDVPSHDIANCIEEDIALGCGMIQAIHKAKSVRVIVVLSHEGMGNRFSNLPESMKIITSLCAIMDKPDLKPFNYVFTKYDRKHKRLLHKQFKALAKKPPYIEYGQDLFEYFIADVAEKTEYDAHVVLPCEDDPQEMLERLCRDTEAEQDPKSLFATFASDFSLKQLKLQMDIQMHDFTTLLLQEEYGSAVCSIHRMEALSRGLPQVEPFVEEAKGSFKKQVAQLWALVVYSIENQDYLTAFYRMSQLKIMAGEFPNCLEYTHLGNKMLSESLKESIMGEFYGKGIHRLILLSDITNQFPEASDFVDLGLEALQEKMQTLLQTGFYDTAIDIIKQLGRAAEQVQGALPLAHQVLEGLQEKMHIIVQRGSYDTAICIIKQLGRAEHDAPGALAVAQNGLQAVQAKLGTLVQNDLHDVLIDMIKQLGRTDQVVHGAFAVAQHGLHSLRESILKTIEEENYEKGLQLIVQISELGEDFAEANACARRALKIVRRRVERSIDSGDYKKACYLLDELVKLFHKLSDGTDVIHHALDFGAQHVCELRMEVVNAFEALMKCKEQKRFSQLLDHTAKCMSTLARSEPMRVICAEYFQDDEYYPKDKNDVKPNYLAILCTPQACTSEEFCVAQVRHLVETISTELPEIEGDSASLENLMTNRKILLSVVLRLRTASIAFKDGPAGAATVATYKNVFSKFQALIESMLSVSETSFQSSMEMKEFEIQAWFLAFLIQGFTKAKVGGVDDDSESIKILEELDHRRVKLMLRFENEVSDTMELLSNYTFLDFQDEVHEEKVDFSKFFEENRMCELEAPRQLLLSLSEAPQLCKMLATQVDTEAVKEPVHILDKSVAKLCADIVSYLEVSYERTLDDLKEEKMTFTSGIRSGQKLLHDITMIRSEFAPVQHWSKETLRGLRPSFVRLAVIQATVQSLIQMMRSKVLNDTGDIGPTAFISNAVGCAGTCFCTPEQEDFREMLPQLPPKGVVPAKLAGATHFAAPEFDKSFTVDNDEVDDNIVMDYDFEAPQGLNAGVENNTADATAS